MVTRPGLHKPAGAGRSRLHHTAHRETINGQAFRLIEEIRRHGMKVGLILNPETPVEAMKYYIHKADKITVMTVDPGFCRAAVHSGNAGENCRAESLARTRRLSYEIEIDGSCNQATYKKTDGRRRRCLYRRNVWSVQPCREYRGCMAAYGRADPVGTETRLFLMQKQPDVAGGIWGATHIRFACKRPTVRCCIVKTAHRGGYPALVWCAA